MTKERKALKLALEKFEFMNHVDSIFADEFDFQINAIKEALAQTEQEPVAWAMYQKGRLLSFWMDKGDAYNFEFTSEHSWSPLYTSPPRRTWAGLTEAQCGVLWKTNMTPFEYYQAIEAKLKEKNERTI